MKTYVKYFLIVFVVLLLGIIVYKKLVEGRV